MKKYFFLLAFFVLFPVVSSAAVECGPGAVSSTTLCNPTESFAPNFPKFLTNVLTVFGVAVGSQAILYVVFAGFRMIVSQGNSEAIATAKASLQWALLGLLLIMSSFVLVYAVANFIGASDVNPDIDNPARDNIAIPTKATNFGAFVTDLLVSFLRITSLLALLMIIINGFRYITAGGNEEQTESAKAGLQWAVLGLFVVSLAYVVVVATAKLINP